VRDLASDGFCIVEAVLDQREVTWLIELIDREVQVDTGRGGVRNLLDIPEMRKIARSAAIRALVEPILGVGAKVVRGTLFDKTGDANWKVPWHQDCTIAVSERLDIKGYGPWSMKAGVVHVQPPASVLERMISVRLHLDDCPEENGALRVILGSHAIGKIPESRIAEVVTSGLDAVCEVGVGGALVIRPLLVHRSSPAVVAGHRRVLHFDFAVAELPGGLKWAAG